MHSNEAPGKITDSAQLSKRRVWILLKYPDSSEFCFETTLSPDILRKEGVVLQEGHLVRLDKKYYINGQFVYRQFPFQGTTVTLWEQLTYTHSPSAAMHEFM